MKNFELLASKNMVYGRKSAVTSIAVEQRQGAYLGRNGLTDIPRPEASYGVLVLPFH